MFLFINLKMLKKDFFFLNKNVYAVISRLMKKHTNMWPNDIITLLFIVHRYYRNQPFFFSEQKNTKFLILLFYHLLIAELLLFVYISQLSK